MSRPDPTLTINRLEKLLSKVIRDGECWMYTGTNAFGYGVVYMSGRRYRVHRLIYVVTTGGPIPEGLMLDHLCRNRACVNPDHLEPVTNRENVLRGVGPTAQNSRKTECSNGHPFNEKNTYTRTDGRGRECRVCHAKWTMAAIKRRRTKQLAGEQQ